MVFRPAGTISRPEPIPKWLFAVSGDLAWVLDAAGGLALDHAGRIALERALA